VTCPLCGGDLVERKSKRGRVFYGCANYPTCNFSSWQRPLATPCPHCGGLLVVQNKQTAKCSACAEQVPLSEVGGQEPASSEESANALANFPSYELEMAG